MIINMERLCNKTEEEKRDLVMRLLTWMSPKPETVDHIADDVDSYLDYILMHKQTKAGLYGQPFENLDLLPRLEMVNLSTEQRNCKTNEVTSGGV